MNTQPNAGTAYARLDDALELLNRYKQKSA